MPCAVMVDVECLGESEAVNIFSVVGVTGGGGGVVMLNLVYSALGIRDYITKVQDGHHLQHAKKPPARNIYSSLPGQCQLW